MSGASKPLSNSNRMPIQILKVKNLETSLMVNRPDIVTGLSPDVAIIGVNRQGLVFGAPKNSFARGNTAGFVLKIDMSQVAISTVNIQARVTDVWTLNEHLITVASEFLTIPDGWDRVIDRLEEKQADIQHLLKSVKGDADDPQ